MLVLSRKKAEKLVIGDNVRGSRLNREFQEGNSCGDFGIEGSLREVSIKRGELSRANLQVWQIAESIRRLPGHV